MDDHRLAADRSADAALVERVRSGDDTAFGELYDRWVDRAHDLAFRIVGDDAPDVVHDAFLVAWRNLGSLRDPAAFGGWLLRSTRNTALDRLERRQRTRATDTEGLAVIEAMGASGADAPPGFGVEDRLRAAEDPARALEDAETVALVWESAEALGERDATVLDLTLRHGLTPAEIGEVVGVNRNAANQLVHRVRSRLGDAVRARVLWRGGTPDCRDLAAALTAAGVDRFGANAVRVIARHADGCAVCEERRRLRLAPAALFGAIPVVGVPALANERIAAALAADGVPMDGSAAGGGPSGPGTSGDGSGGAGEGSGGSTTEELAAAESATPGRRALRRHWPRAAALVAAVAALVAGGIWLLAAGDGAGDGADGGDAAVQTGEPSAIAPNGESTTTTTIPDGEDALPPLPEDGPVPAEAPAPSDVPPVAPPPPLPPQAVSPPRVSLSVTDAPAQSTYTPADAPRLVWSVSGGDVVEVTGPNFPTSHAPSGDAPLCPTEPPGWTFCRYAPGSWTYRVRVFDAAGGLIAEQTAVLVRP